MAPTSVVLTGFSYSSSSSEPPAELRFLSVSTSTPETASSSPETSVSLMSWGLSERAPLGIKVEAMMTAARTVKWTPAMLVRTVWGTSRQSHGQLGGRLDTGTRGRH
jgi:hypothetical protein